MENKKNILANHLNCTGCAACYNVCRVNAINMIADDAGFLYPVIDSEICINCGMCQSSCPVLSFQEEKEKIKSFYIGYSNNDTLIKNAASGGIFSEIAEWYLHNNGIVYGACYGEEFRVQHKRCTKKKELCLLQGSKYVQSNIEKKYRDVKSDLECGRKVCFSGTPCQIAGLKMYLKHNFDNLITIDFLCHSVGSPKAFELYLKRRTEQIGNIKSIHFKSKKYGYSFPTLELENVDGKKYYYASQSDPFMNLFLSGRISRSSCEECMFRTNHVSDITLADNYSRDTKNKGSCRIFVRNQKGRDVLTQLGSYVTLDEFSIDSCMEKGDFYNHIGNPKIDFTMVNVIGEDAFCNRYIRVRLDRIIIGKIRFLLQRLGLQGVAKKIFNKIRK